MREHRGVNDPATVEHGARGVAALVLEICPAALDRAVSTATATSGRSGHGWHVGGHYRGGGSDTERDHGMMIEIVLPASGDRVAIDHSSILRVREVRRDFGGRWARCELTVKGSRYKLWSEQSYSDVLKAIRAAESPHGPAACGLTTEEPAP